MGRKKLPARLELRTDKVSSSQGTRDVTSWEIRDGTSRIRTGCSESETERANESLQAYLGQKQRPVKRGGDPSKIKIGDILTVYFEAKTPNPETHRGREIITQIGRLNDFWGNKKIPDVKGSECRAYADQRTTKNMARNELEILRSAINLYHKEHVLTYVPTITLPEKPPARYRWLTRSEAAKILWQLWKAKDPLTGIYTARHLARFFLIAIRTGTREKAILSLQWHPNPSGGHIDLERGVIYRAAHGAKQTKKRKAPLKIPRRLLPHLVRWQRDGLPFVVHFGGMPIKRANATAWANALRRAELHGQDVNIHTLKHTCATWLMQSGVGLSQAASFLSTTVETIERVYWHHHPDFQSDAAEAF